MKASEFKKILKPLIEQAVKDVLLQEGVLSNIVAEVARGMNQPILENRNNSASQRTSERETALMQEEYERERQEKIKRLNESTGMSNIFDNVTQIKESTSPHSPLSGVGSSDSGVDIAAIQQLSGGKWRRLAGGKK